MSGDTVIKHELEAYNFSAASENKIHDETVAQKFKAGWCQGLRSMPI